MRVLRNFQALGVTRLPRSAIILDVLPRPDVGLVPPALVCSVDNADEEIAVRRFAVLRSDAAIPDGATFLKSWRDSGGWGLPVEIVCLFELVGEEIPEAIPPEAHRHFLHLAREGFTLVRRVWRAPAEHGPLGQADIIALTELAEHGYGEVVGA